MEQNLNIIRNENQIKKFGRSTNGLCFKTVFTNGNLTQEQFKSNDLKDITNLLSVQFLKLDYINNFNSVEAKKLIDLEKDVSNKIILVPLNYSVEDFKVLNNYFIQRYPAESYTLVIFGLMDINLSDSILEANKYNKFISSVEIIEHYREEIVSNIASIIYKYSNFYNIGVIQMHRNQGEQYLGFSPFLFYRAFGAKFFSKAVKLTGGTPKNYYLLDKETYLMKKLTSNEVAKLKQEHNSKLANYLEELNLNLNFKILDKVKDLSLNEVRALFQERSGKNIS